MTPAAQTAATTLETTARLGGPARPGSYRRLVSGPGRPVVVREELAAARPGREGRRTPLACFVPFTDPHPAGVQEEWAGGPGDRNAELPGITA
ncbi:MULTISPECIES: hypothetical protein [unclassified Streptomyces]|uniref:hypothetical protein n=1 Tax=unclassified Streptomyces TaxID=2593676 RepID=UPI00225B0DC4|nr:MULTISPECIES: hypothetical protein [unclassified Streptomyces]MCX4992480.1 hypothetical protein [Streptomyces sp. NBC_00568]MCX5002282.1 hypothetical protein [Streptomyces sp. NBC_00638]